MSEVKSAEDETVCFYCGFITCRCDEMDDDDEPELDEDEEAMYDCHGFFDSQRADSQFMCGAVGSEDCDECPMNKWLGLTNRQIDELEMRDDE